jgi:hypothetical protein
MLLSDVRHAAFALFNLNFASIQRISLAFRRDAVISNRPENIRIHLAVSRVRFYLFRFNSSGNFCDGGAIRSRGLPKHRRNATIANTTGIRVLTAIAAAVQIRLMKLDLIFVAKRAASCRTRTISPSSVTIRKSGRREV